MAYAYTITQDTVARADCADDAAVTANIAAGTTLGVDEVSGGWYHTGKGWIYMMYSPGGGKNDICILDKADTSTASLDKGSSVTFKQGDDFYDIGGNLMKSATNYIISDYNSSTGVVTLTDGTNTYHVNKDLISTIDTDGTVVIPGNIAEASTGVLTDDGTYTTVTKESVLDQAKNALKSAKDSFFSSGDSATSNGKNLDLRVSTAHGIFGMPYQYMPIADPREDDSNQDAFGLTYSDRIAARMPLMVMIPGVPEFLAGKSDKEKKSFAEKLLNLNAGDLSDDLTNLISTPGKYYGMKQDWASYYKYVDVMCNAAAHLLNVDDVDYFNGKLGDYNWYKASNDDLRKKLNYKGGVAFYVNAENTVSESFSNATTQSALLSKINGLSDIGREINFITGAKNDTLGADSDKVSNGDNAMKANEKAQQAEKIAGHGGTVQNLIGALGSGLTTVISGGKLMFPEIWQDSQFSRDYNVSIKLTSPDCDNLSIFLNIIVPYLHLVAFVAPHNVNVNGYISPFLARVYYKGMFNCDMGMVTSMSVSKGGDGNWTPSGIPTVIEVQLSIKELYGTMSINNSQQANGTGILSNLILMDYIGNLCGINIQDMDLPRMAAFYYAMYVHNRFTSYFYENIESELNNWIDNRRLGFSRLFGG